jgi:hypothetical protein
LVGLSITTVWTFFIPTEAVDIPMNPIVWIINPSETSYHTSIRLDRQVVISCPLSVCYQGYTCYQGPCHFHVQSLEVRDDVSLCLYWWDCQSPLFELSFHNKQLRNQRHRMEQNNQYGLCSVG